MGKKQCNVQHNGRVTTRTPAEQVGVLADRERGVELLDRALEGIAGRHADAHGQEDPGRQETIEE